MISRGTQCCCPQAIDHGPCAGRWPSYFSPTLSPALMSSRSHSGTGDRDLTVELLGVGRLRLSCGLEVCGGPRRSAVA